jgi:CheY-like chemotaxis protein
VIRKVLIVDDDHIWLRLIKKKFEKYSDKFEALFASDGMRAVELLKTNTISLVVTDLQMPEMDGFSLLARLSEQYPDIPVIIVTAYSTPKSKKRVLEAGAAGYIEKPFVIEELAHKIIECLRKESEGGTLQTVPLNMFIQLVEMEQKTCTIRVMDQESGTRGVLFFLDGELMDSRVRDKQGVDAAYEIFSWGSVTLAIEDACAVKERRIEDGLQAVLLEAMRLKDDLDDDDTPDEDMLAEEDDLDIEAAIDVLTRPDPEPDQQTEAALPEPLPTPGIPAPLTPAQRVRELVAPLLNSADDLKSVEQDTSWDGVIRSGERLGQLFDAGRFRCGYIDNDGPADLLLASAGETVVVSIKPKTPRNRLLEVLSESLGD